MSVIAGEQQLLRLFIKESDAWEGRPLYKAIVEKLRQAPLAGCTVLRGVEGFGAHRQMHDSRYEILSQDLPIVIEVIDTEEKIRNILPELDPMIRVGLMTLEKVDIEIHRPA
jgi:PII-like signaling protein